MKIYHRILGKVITVDARMRRDGKRYQEYIVRHGKRGKAEILRLDSACDSELKTSATRVIFASKLRFELRSKLAGNSVWANKVTA